MSQIKIFDTTTLIRLTKIALLFFFAVYAALVTLGNVVDPQSNLMFVKHVLSMDMTFQKPELMGRAITTPWVHTAALWLIICVEALICFMCSLGAWRLYKVLGSEQEVFHAAKAFGLIGLLLALSLWFFGFQTIGGEWFASWQSAKWNGFEPAGRIMNFLFGSLIFVSLKND